MTQNASRAAIRDWLLNDARMQADRRKLISDLGARLLASGVPVARITTGVPLLHPVLDTSSVQWEAGSEAAERLWRMKPENLPLLMNSPLRIVYDGGGPVRCAVGPEPEDGEFGVIADLRAAGMTDYMAAPLRFSDGTTKAITYATRASGGFSDDDVDHLLSLSPAMAMVLEIQTLKRSARTFLNAYLGTDAAKRVMDGAIKRGMGEFIPCVVMFCDLRGFTGLSGRLNSEDLLALLNEYFDATTDAVSAHRGEVLKFMGDAMLAVFAHGETGSEAAAAGRALDAAIEAQSRIAKINVDRAKTGAPKIHCGVALHAGEVLYGNIGGRDRLDFTVIGPAVNLASRIEKLCGEKDEPLLMSEAFARLTQRQVRSIGCYTFKGVDVAQEVFAPD